MSLKTAEHLHGCDIQAALTCRTPAGTPHSRCTVQGRRPRTLCHTGRRPGHPAGRRTCRERAAPLRCLLLESMEFKPMQLTGTGHGAGKPGYAPASWHLMLRSGKVGVQTSAGRRSSSLAWHACGVSRQMGMPRRAVVACLACLSSEGCSALHHPSGPKTFSLG